MKTLGTCIDKLGDLVTFEKAFLLPALEEPLIFVV